ncbi:conserved hypothetical protein [Lodderomyces elongisporus NRRL YB-4239]|uniref:DNA damage-binding protein 1 n=1 Tax=Lodderomyces elongisporus (strain ATCC 11503 / CBS 2605 / JCM 1781 / NBRC 1676 / NRRL YB-4239) TaxID=379508 RepID=A5DXW5_LODEL|nr:conserved hypothetical protein [Lodderomyces elongisporus NRRL YB-4239]
MLLNEDSVNLYNLTVKCATNFSYSVIGRFVPHRKDEQLVLVSSSHMLLYYMDENTGSLINIVNQNLFGVVNQVHKVQLNSNQDALVFTSDSGNLSVLTYDEHLKKFKSILQQPIAKNGWNKTYPGEYLAVDPQNRCILVGAVEREKLLFRIETTILENGSAKFEISSPITFQTRRLLCLKLVALYTEFENPSYCALEFDPEKQQTLFALYEFDQGLNYIVKQKVANSILPNDANYLIPVLGAIGGVLLCGENWIRFVKANKDNIVLPLPRRGNQNTIIVNHVSHFLKKKGLFIFMQSTLGDILTLVFDYDSDRSKVKDITITYFDTIPPSQSLNIFKSGFLFANSLNNNQVLYQFMKLGADLSDATSVKLSTVTDANSIDIAKKLHYKFEVRSLQNLSEIDTLESLSPITDSKLLPNSHLATLSSNHKMKTVMAGIPTSVLVESPLTLTPTNVFTTKLSEDSPNDEYLVFTSTLSSETLVFSIGESLEDVTDSKFVLDQPTIAVQQVGKASVVQIYAYGLRHISTKIGNSKKVTDWYPPAGISIVHAATNNKQVLIALSNSEVVYFETDPTDDQLLEYQEKLEVTSPVTSMTISPERSSFAIIGCSDETIQVISLQPQSCLEVKSLQALSSKANSLAMLTNERTTYVHIGMENGVYARTKIDKFSGKLSDTRVKYLGSKPIALEHVKLSEEVEGILAISSRTWAAFHYRGTYKIIPLLGVDIDHGACIISEDIGGEAIVGTKGNNLVILSAGEEDSLFDPNQTVTVVSTNLRYQPRKLLTQVGSRSYISQVGVNIVSPYATSLTKVVKDKVDSEYYETFGYERELGRSASCVQILQNRDVKQTLEFNKNETIIGMTNAVFNKNEYLIVGVINTVSKKSTLYTFRPDKKKFLQYTHKTELNYIPLVIDWFNDKVLVCSGNSISLYDLGQRQLLRKSFTRIDFLKNIVKYLPLSQNRVVFADSQSASVVFAKFDADGNQFIPIADDVIKRNCTALSKLDYDTIICGDKFGQISISRLDSQDSRQVDQEWSIFKARTKELGAGFSSCVCKLHNICEFFIPDIITSFQPSRSTKKMQNTNSFNAEGTTGYGDVGVGIDENVDGGNAGDSDDGCIVYTGIQGTIGVLILLLTKHEVELLFNLQLELRKLCNHDDDAVSGVASWISPLGKDHLKHRSYFNPVKNIIDGDFVECYLQLLQNWKVKIGEAIDKSPNEIEKRLNDIRNRSII